MQKLGYRHAIGTMMAASIAITPAMAKSDLINDLNGMRASSGEMELQDRGYIHISTHEGHHKKTSYWYKSSKERCLQIETRDGRYGNVQQVPKGDCNQRSGGGGSTAAAVGVGVAALAIAIAASHKSHHHDGNKHYDSAKEEAQYERGYSDGLHGASYHNYDKTDAYSRGYEAGIDQNGYNTGYRSSHGGGGGYRASVAVSDLQGWDAVRADDEMRARGFTNVDAFTSGNTLYGIWYMKRTGQCIQSTSADGRIYDIRDIQTHPRCG